MALSVNINSFNVNGLGMKNKRIAIFSWLKSKYSGIYFLQETHSSSNCEQNGNMNGGEKCSLVMDKQILRV